MCSEALIMKLHIDKSGYQEHLLSACDNQLEICIDERIDVSLMLTYSGDEVVTNMQVSMMQGSVLHILLKNETAALTLKVHGTILRDADFHLAYCDLDEGSAMIDGYVVLKEEGAHADLLSACIVHQKKHFNILCLHEVPYTTATMEHYAVVMEHGDYRMEACGKIMKGAHDSVSHQSTRVLTLSEHHHSQVIPLLLIDENDVKASHATTLGQPDENQLYYLQTRGLSREQALGLLSIGYIMPITDIFEDEEKKAELKNEIEMKVGLHA